MQTITLATKSKRQKMANEQHIYLRGNLEDKKLAKYHYTSLLTKMRVIRLIPPSLLPFFLPSVRRV